MKESGSVVITLALLAGAVGAGCANVPIIRLFEGAEVVEVLPGEAVPPRCETIRPVAVAHGSGCGGFGHKGDFPNAYNAFRNAVYSAGGNAGVILERSGPRPTPGCYVNEYRIEGLALDCPER